MFCPKCGQWNAGSATQCTACGTSLLPPSYNSTPSAYPTAMPVQTAYPPYVPQSAPNYQSAPTAYPNYPQPQQPFPNAPVSPGGAPSAYPTYSPLPPGSVYSAQAPPAYGTSYPAQTQHAPPPPQCRVCGSMLAYGMLSCSICTVPLGMIANPHDPTVTTYLDARALNQPGTSPVYAAPGAYAGRAAYSGNDVPDEARQGWNWAAALNSTLWAFTHRSAGWGLICGTGLFLWVTTILGMASTSTAELRSDSNDSTAVAAGGIILGAVLLCWIIKTLYLGSKGNAIAWRSGRYTNISQMKNIQRQWATWSIVVFFVASAVLIAATVIAGKH